MKLPKNGRMVNGVIFASESVVPYLKRNSSKDFLPTPTASPYGSSQNGQRSDGTKFKQAGKPSLETLARMGMLNIPTPTTQDSENNCGPSQRKRNSLPLNCVAIDLVEEWIDLPTPTTFDSGQALPPRKKNNSGGQKPPLVSVIGGRLNPQFVEWLMGYPEDYTKSLEEIELDNLETALSLL